MTGIEVTEAASGRRLDAFLAVECGSRAAAQRAIAEGRVKVDGVPRGKSWTVSRGESVTIEPAPPAERQATAPGATIEPVWSDDRLAVVDKPAGIVSHPAPGHREGTLSQLLSAWHGGEPVGLVHRLDMDTSGLLAVALDEEGLRSMREELQARRIRREYTALVVGVPKSSSGTIEAPIGRDRRVRTRMSVDTDTPRAAVTHFEVIEAFSDCTLLRVALETGRTHQIRVHLAEIGLPVAGDPAYGRPGFAGLERQFLHASRLAFTNPFTGSVIDLESPLPADLATALDRVRGGGR